MMPPIIQTWRARYTAKDTLPSAFSLFVSSWQALVLNWQMFAQIVGVPFVTLMAGTGLVLWAHGTKLQNPGEAVGGAVMCIGILLAFSIMLPMLVYVQLQSARGKTVTYREVLQAGWHYMLRLWLLVLLTYALFVAGLFLLIVPGLFVLRRYLLAPYFLMDEDPSSIFTAMRASAKKSAQYSPSIWGIIGMYAIFLAVARFIPFVGSLLSLLLFAVYSCATAVRYKQIKAKDTAKAERKEARAKAKKSQRRSKK